MIEPHYETLLDGAGEGIAGRLNTLTPCVTRLRIAPRNC